MVENEIQYLSWSAYRQMAPPILQLEVTRLGRLIAGLPLGSDARNALVRARFKVIRFMEELEAAEKETLATSCGAALQAALLAVAAAAPEVDTEKAATLRYVAERLRYVHDRIALIY